MWLAAMASPLFAAKARLSRTRVSAITDELARTQTDAVQAARGFGFESVELRNVPETGKPFVGLSDPELKRWAAELAGNKLNVSVLHVPGSLTASADFVEAAKLLNAAAVWPQNSDARWQKVLVDAGRLTELTAPSIAGAWTPREDWLDAWKKLPRGRIATVRVGAATLDRQNPARLPWKSILEMLQKEGYAGTLTVEPASEDSVRELIHLIGQVA
jgi:hypothetical protein